MWWINGETSGTTRWPWIQRRSSSTDYIIVEPNSSTGTKKLVDQNSTVEPKKLVKSNDLRTLLAWHTWAIISCSATIVLLYLNLSGYAIEGFGRTKRETANILGVLQIAAKCHEVTIVSSLVNIAREWIQESMISDGTVLALMGSEKSLDNLGLFLTQEFRAVVSYTTSVVFLGKRSRAPNERQRRRPVFLLVSFMTLACLLSAMAGPASAVLMVPRLDWFYETDLVYRYSNETTISACYPNVFIDTRLANSHKPAQHSSITFESIDYWSQVFSGWSIPHIHRFYTTRYQVTMNTTTGGPTIDRRVTFTSDTNFTGVMAYDTYRASVQIQYPLEARNSSSPATYVAELTGIEATTVCQQRKMIHCDNGTPVDINSSEWCYKPATKDPSGRKKRSSRDLLLILDPMEMDVDERKEMSWQRFYMTEGARMKENERFADSLVFVFKSLSYNSLMVCSTVASLKGVTARSTSELYSVEATDFHQNLSYYEQNSTRIPLPPRKLLYHENWLDSIHRLQNESNLQLQEGSMGYPDRMSSNSTKVLGFREWGGSILKAIDSYGSSPIHMNLTNQYELVAGGAYVAVLLTQGPSNSPYPQQYMNSTLITADYPSELMPEPFRDYSKCTQQPLKVYRLGYGFRLSSRTGILGVVVLVTHAVIVILGSVWQCKKRSVIRAWRSIPEFGALCLGSQLIPGALDNTCAGFNRNETFNTFVRVQETTAEHLELVVVPDGVATHVQGIDQTKEYGCMERVKGLKEKID